MKPLTFFRCSLLAPVFLPLVAYFVGGTSAVAFLLIMSLVFGGLPYLLVAVFLWVKLGKLHTVPQYIRLSLLAPLIFVPLQCAAWLAWALVDTTVPRTYNNLLVSLFPISAYALLFGYLYVLAVAAVYALLRSVGVVAEAAPVGVENAA